MDIKKPKNLKARRGAFHRRTKKATKAVKARAKDYMAGEGKLAEVNPKRVTNNSMNKHRKEVLEGAKKFKYPLKHSKYRIAIISSVIIFIAFLAFGFFSYSLLYKQQSIGDFAFRVSKVVPAPVARVGSSWISFEKYLFEVRQNVHYLTNQENVDFEKPEGKELMKSLKENSLVRVQENEVIRQLANQNGIKVTEEEIDASIQSIRDSGGINDDSRTLEDTLRDFYGWDLDDLRRVIKGQLLKEKLPYILDTVSKEAASSVYEQILSGEKTFEVAAKEFSEDELTKDKDGVIGTVNAEDTDLPKELLDTSFALKDGEVSGVIETSFGLHIVKRVSTISEGEIKISHILFKWENPQTFIDAYKEQVEIKSFISF